MFVWSLTLYHLFHFESFYCVILFYNFPFTEKIKKHLDKVCKSLYNILVSLLIVGYERNPEGGVFEMAKVSAKYEVMVVYSLKNGEEALKALLEKFKATIEKHAEALEINEDWGKRKLAYPINDETEGYYVIYTFESKPDYPAELSRRFNITDGVLRSLVTVC